MSAEAQEYLQRIWKKLHFAKINRTVARQPEDVLSITVYQATELTTPNGRPIFGHLDRSYRAQDLKRLSDVREQDRWRTKVSWSHYYGFTDDGIYFQRDGYCEMDFGIDLTLNFGTVFANHTTGGYRLPEDGQLICGEVEETAKGKKFVRWFPCDEAFLVLVACVMGNIEVPSEERLGRLLLASEPHDKYWALARLVFFDNVQAFVDVLRYRELNRDFLSERVVPDWAKHPAAGMTYGKDGYKCLEGGMDLPQGVAQYVHLLSYRLGQPQWSQEFLRLTSDQGVGHFHPAPGGICDACIAEIDEFPDDEYGLHDSQFPYSDAANERRKYDALHQ